MDKSVKKILIVEDERPIARALELKLISSGFQAEIAKNGTEAVDKIKSGGFDMILLDLVLPEIDGFTILQKAKEEIKTKTPIIVLSNLSQADDVKKAKALGAMDFLVKSNTPISEIVNKIKKYFNL
jgi:DNA-binding response OmpR family regulator